MIINKTVKLQEEEKRTDKSQSRGYEECCNGKVKGQEEKGEEGKDHYQMRSQNNGC